MNCKFLSDVLSTLSNPTDDRQCESEDKSENKVFVTWPQSTHSAKFEGNRPCG